MKNPISPVQRGKLPSFVRAEYPAFEKFMVKYFAWLETDGNFVDIIESWKNNTDPTNEVAPYVDALLKDLGWDWAGPIFIDKKLLVATLRDFYLSRGTKKSFEWLFAVLFNQQVQIRHPRESLLIPSQAAYVESAQIFCTANNRGTTAFDTVLEDLLAREPVTITGAISGAQVQVEDAILLLSGDSSYLNMFIEIPLKDFEVQEDVQIRSPNAIIVERLHNVLAVEIDNHGSGLDVGQQIIATPAFVSGSLRVTGLLGGGIETVTIQNGGSGYQVGDKITAPVAAAMNGFGFYAKVSSVIGGIITGIKIYNHGEGYEYMPTLAIDSQNGAGARLVGNSTKIGGVQAFAYAEPYVNFDPDEIVVSAGNATFRVSEQSVFRSKAYADRRGVLGENSTLIDSNRFQQFSYDLLSAVPSKYQKAVVDDLLHPAGYVRTTVLTIDESGVLNSVLTGGSSNAPADPTDYLVTLAGVGIVTLQGEEIVTL